MHINRTLCFLLILLVANVIFSDEISDSLLVEIESLPFSYEKADKIWDLALHQDNITKQPEEAILNLLKASEMLLRLDSLNHAMKTSETVFIIAYNNPEYFEISKKAYNICFTIIDAQKFDYFKERFIRSVGLHFETAFHLNEMEYLRKCYAQIEKILADPELDNLRVEYINYKIYIIRYFEGENRALETCLKVYEDVENDKYNISFGLKQKKRVELLAIIQNYYYYKGDIEQSNRFLDEALKLGTDLYMNHPDSLNFIEKETLKHNLGRIMNLKVDNIEINKDNLPKIENDYLKVNNFVKSFDKDMELNNFSKIAHAYDIVYSGKHPKIGHYLNKVENSGHSFKRKMYDTNFHLTKARYLLNNQDYDKANEAFIKVEEFIDKIDQPWINFNYVMERSRYYFAHDQPKIGYDMVTKFYTSIDKEFTGNIAKKTAELNSLLKTQSLEKEQSELKKQLEIESLRNNRDNLVTTLVGVVLGFTTLLLVNNLRMNKKLKFTLNKQSKELDEEIMISQSRAERLIITEKLSTTGEIASSIAHEIKNPLTNIITGIKLLRSAKDQEEITKYAQICERNSWLAINKVNSLLDYAKQNKMNFGEHSLKDILKDAYNLTKGALEESETQLNFIYKTYDDVLNVDRKELTGVVVNLILNSIQAMNPDNNTKRIDLMLKEDESNFYIEVRDNGVGIPQEYLTKVLNPFFTTKENGSGLGLNYAQKVVVAHQGFLEVVSELGEYTNIIIRLPFQRA